MQRDVYRGTLRLRGEENSETIREAGNYASVLAQAKRYREAKSLMRTMIPLARRVLGEGDDITLRVRWIYAMTLSRDDGATLDDLREAVEMLEEIARTARRVLGAPHPTAAGIEGALTLVRAQLEAREA